MIWGGGRGKVKAREAHYGGVSPLGGRGLRVASGEWTFLAALHLEVPGGRGHKPRRIMESKWPPDLECSQDNCDLWGPTASLSQAGSTRGAEVSAEG